MKNFSSCSFLWVKKLIFRIICLLSACLFLPDRAQSQTFVHPGIPFTTYDLNQLKANITVDPWKTAYATFAADAHSQLTYGMQGPFAQVGRAIDVNRTQWESDMQAVFNLTFMWEFTGNDAYAQKATNILDAWATTQTQFTGDEANLDIGDYSERFVPAADILKSTFSGWTAANTAHVNSYFINVLYPPTDVPNPVRGNNQGALSLKAAVGMAAFLDDPVRWNAAINSLRQDAGGGLRNSLGNGELGDAGRDEGHWAGELQALAWAIEVAWKQRVDLYAELGNRMLAASELYSQYRVTTSSTVIPFIPFGGPYAYYTGFGGPRTYLRTFNAYNIILGGYVLRKGLAAPYTTKLRDSIGENSSGFLYRKTADTSTAVAPSAIVYPSASGTVASLTDADIGQVGLKGSSNNNGGVWTVKGAGADIPVPPLSSPDAFNYSFQQITGDGVVIARVTGIQNTSTDAKAGVMIRESLDPNARYTGIFLSPNGGVNATWRGASAWSKTATSWNNPPGGYSNWGGFLPPFWLKIERLGTRFTTTYSVDGINWTCIAAEEIPLANTVYFGLAVSSHNTSALNTATFDNVSITNSSAAGSPVINSSTSDTTTIGTGYNYSVVASNSPTSYGATGLPTGLTIDTNTGIISGTSTTPGRYFLNLSATNAAGTGTSILSLTVLNNSAPASPTGLTASRLTSTTVGLSWTGSANATSYSMKRSLSPGGPYSIIITGVTSTSFVDASPFPGANYYVVSALTGSLESPNSSEASVILAPAVPAKPTVTNLNAEVDLSWPIAQGAASYNVKRATVSGGPYTTIASTVTSTSYADVSVSNGVQYYYVISSVLDTLESANSPEELGVPGSSSNVWSPTAGTGTWSTGTNWVSGNSPISPAYLTFGTSSTSTLTNDITGLQVSRLTFGPGASAYTISGNAVSFGSDIRNYSTNSQIVNDSIGLTNNLKIAADSGNVTLAGGIGGSGSILKSGAATSILSSASSSYSGGTMINGSNSGSWPFSYNMAIAGIGTGSSGAPLTGPLGKGAVMINGGCLTNNGVNAVIYNDIVAQSGTTGYLVSNAGGLTLSGRLLGSGTITHDGNSTAALHLNGDNSSFTGTFVTVNRSSNARTRFDAASAGSVNANWVFNCSFTDGQGFTFTGTIHFGSLSGGGYMRSDGGAPIVAIGGLNTNSTFSGTVVGGLALLKEGTGTLRFTGTSTAGTALTINSGTVLVDSVGKIAFATAVNAGTFGGIGTATNTVTVGTGSGAGATLAPGSGGIGTLTIGSALTLNSDAAYALEVNSTVDSADKVSANGVTLNNAILSITDLAPATFNLGTSFTIIDNTGTTAVNGIFNGLPELSVVTISGVDFRITYKGGTGNDIVLLDNRTAPAYIASASTAQAFVNKTFSYTITALNSPTSFSASGLPTGLTLDPVTGIISGAPTASGTFSITLGTTNANGNATALLTLNVQGNTVTNLFVAAGDAKDTLSWDPMVSILSYNVKRATISGGPYTTIGNTTTTGYMDNTAVNGTVYYYVVSMVDNGGENPNSNQVAASPNVGQVGYYNFDETTGLKAFDYWGGKSGTLISSTVTHVAGKVNNALNYNGTSTSYTTLPTGVVSSMTTFTVAAWVKMTSISTWMRVIDFGTGSTNYMFLTPQAGTSGTASIVRYAIKVGSGAEQNMNFNYVFPLNTWVHLAITQSATSTTMYINGTSVATSTAITFRPSGLGNTTLNYIGKSQFADPMLNGAVDELKLYSRALSASEVNALTTSTVLPISFLSVNAVQKNSAIEVNWKMADETGIRYYEVERSGDGTTFNTIGKVTPSLLNGLYKWTDDLPLPNANFYRIKAVQASGEIVYSSIVNINTVNLTNSITSYPNPIVGNVISLHFNNSPQGNYEVLLIDNLGRQVDKKSISHLGGSANYSLTLSGTLAKGIYNLQVNGNITSESIKIMVK